MTSETTDPLAGLDAIDWAGLEHAYGDADDVPALLRALGGPEETERRRALHALYGNIFHQGSRYPASAAAVPFLARLATDPGRDGRSGRSIRNGRADVVRLLASLAIGYDEAHLPDGIDIARTRRERAEFAAQDPAAVLAEMDAWVAAAPDEGERRVREFRRSLFDVEDHLGSMDSELAAYDAVRAELPALSVLLEDEDAEVRATTAYLLAWFPEEAARTLPRLLALLDDAVDRAGGVAGLGDEQPAAAVTASALVAAGLLGGPGLVPRLRPFLGAAGRLPRWAAAVALARLGTLDGASGDGPTDDGVPTAAVLAELAAAEAAPPEPGPPLLDFHDGDLRGYAALSLTQLSSTHPGETLDAVTDGLARASGISAFAVTAAALSLAFPTRPTPLPAFTALDERQQRLIRVLADLDASTWQWGNFLEILRSWALPRDRPAMRAYAGLPDA
ncbi:hypothetical protein ACIPYS_20595 [Kitasatospora sp. NPDC089913]|uniref:hypothetical protein n=1 Tax=Kitasatospora sp. NPDC089913 TaxID=3364080 RepID=UPI0037F3787A